jgi:uncharacterized membrane protein YphA (DoxX/SURF4 family)
MLAGMFVYGGLDSLQHPDGKVAAANKVVGSLAEASGDRVTTAQIVRANGAIQVAAGVALASGLLTRPAALALMASLIPTTVAGHRFWEETDPGPRHIQRIQFFKNLSMMGGLLLAFADAD